MEAWRDIHRHNSTPETQTTKIKIFTQLWTVGNIFSSRTANDLTWHLVPPPALLPEDLARHPHVPVTRRPTSTTPDHQSPSLRRPIPTTPDHQSPSSRQPTPTTPDHQSSSSSDNILRTAASLRTSTDTATSTNEELNLGIQQLFKEIEQERRNQNGQQIITHPHPPEATLSLRQQLIHYARNHQTATAPDLQLYIYATMAYTDITDEDLFRLIDSSYGNRQGWRERLELLVTHSTDIRQNGPHSDEDIA
nr:uncharacterized protein LOC112289492 [Physcomitrium patens]|eukprot:XP_024390503.1 uncharacterized protein LOC112289492 [Physcomitrella patens]